MHSILQRFSLFAAALSLTGATAYADNEVTLTFQRSGSDAASVVTSVAAPTLSSDITAGLSATVVSVSHSMKTSVSSSLLCPDVNGNTSPTITYVLSVSGLPADYSFDHVGLDVYALNASGASQSPTDGKNRQFNVTVEQGSASDALTPFASLTNIDIASGITDLHKEWGLTTSAAVTASDPLYLKITVTKGTANDGCFFGLSSVTLSKVLGETTPSTETAAVYTLKWKNNTSSYMMQSGTGIVIDSYSIHNPIFWRFIPTANEGCYYIQNTATGQYIGSCNMTPSSASKVAMSDTPVEYYVGTSASTSGDNVGCVWLSSTDCSNYSSETSDARCLNKDGASQSIITWKAGTSYVGSYWTLTATDDLYEPKAFTAATESGNASSYYQIIAEDGTAFTTSGEWSRRAYVAAQKWYFVGTGNADGGYQIVAAATNETLNDGARYRLAVSEVDGYYCFLDSDGAPLSLNGVTRFKFSAFRSSFSLSAQIYHIPCGTLGSHYITSATIASSEGTLYYPQPTVVGTAVTYPTAAKPTARYTILSKDAATVSDEGATLTVKRSAAPAEGEHLYAYVDWDRDGVFETMEELPATQTGTLELRPTDDAKEGRMRLRLRLTDNGLDDAEDDVNGQVLDLMISYIGAATQTVEPTVTVNDVDRGAAVYDTDSHIATATPRGTSLFLYWKEDTRLLTTDSSVEAQPTARQRTLTAYFSPNLDETNGLSPAVLSAVDAGAQIEVNRRLLRVVGGEVNGLFVFNTEGGLVASAQSDTLSCPHLPRGTYVVKAVTTVGVATRTVHLQ